MRTGLRQIGLMWLVVLLLSSPPSALARQDTNYIYCLDTIVLNSSAVYVGTIVDIPRPDPRLGGQGVTVAVGERIRGIVSDKTQTRLQAAISTLNGWRANGTELLFVAMPGDWSMTFDLSDPDLRVLTADMRFLTDRASVLQASREALRTHPGVTRISTVERRVPPEIAQAMPERLARCREDSWWYNCLSTSVPVDEFLRQWAERAVSSAFLWERAEAADALRHFPSDANAGRLRQLLDDPAVVLVPGPTGVRDTQLYIVRKRAYESLTEMGVRCRNRCSAGQSIVAIRDSRAVDESARDRCLPELLANSPSPRSSSDISSDIADRTEANSGKRLHVRKWHR